MADDSEGVSICGVFPAASVDRLVSRNPVCVFVLYGIVLICMKRKTMGEQDLWKIVIAVTVMLVLSYPAFSYDMFNYMFTAKTVLIYQKILMQSYRFSLPVLIRGLILCAGYICPVLIRRFG